MDRPFTFWFIFLSLQIESTNPYNGEDWSEDICYLELIIWCSKVRCMWNHFSFCSYLILIFIKYRTCAIKGHSRLVASPLRFQAKINLLRHFYVIIWGLKHNFQIVSEAFNGAGTVYRYGTSLLRIASRMGKSEIKICWLCFFSH